MEKERKFRFVGDPNSQWYLPVEKNKVYPDTYFSSCMNASRIGLAYDLGNREDWEEVFESEQPETLLKDTDLGYFAGLAISGLLSNPKTSEQISSQIGDVTPEKANKIVSITAIAIAKSLIEELKKEIAK